MSNHGLEQCLNLSAITTHESTPNDWYRQTERNDKRGSITKRLKLFYVIYVINLKPNKTYCISKIVAGCLIWVRCGAPLLREDSLHRFLISNRPNSLNRVQPRPVVVLTSTSIPYIFLPSWYQNTWKLSTPCLLVRRPNRLSVVSFHRGQLCAHRKIDAEKVAVGRGGRVFPWDYRNPYHPIDDSDWWDWFGRRVCSTF